MTRMLWLVQAGPGTTVALDTSFGARLIGVVGIAAMIGIAVLLSNNQSLSGDVRELGADSVRLDVSGKSERLDWDRVAEIAFRASPGTTPSVFRISQIATVRSGSCAGGVSSTPST